jgi:hypothetical protein
VAADVKISGEWQRVAIDGAAGRRRVVTMLRKEYVPGRAGRSPSPG